MKVEKNTVVALILAHVGLYLSVADARISGDQIRPKTDAVLAHAVLSPNAAFNQCVHDNFVMEDPSREPPLLGKLYSKISAQIAAGFIYDDATFVKRTNDLLKQACGDSQMAGGGKKSK
jgi:hypothetical protein